MLIASLLSSDTVLVDTSVAGAQEARAALVLALQKAKGIDPEPTVQALAARERQGSTFIDLPAGGVALPHALGVGCRQLVVAAATSRNGIPWGGAASRARMVFLVLSPVHMHPLGLQVLARIARLCEIPGVLSALVEARSPAEFIAQLASAEEPLGEMAMTEGMPRFCVFGAGHGGLAMAGHLALSGCPVNLVNRSAERIVPILARGGIDVTGEVEGFAKLKLVTTDLAAALKEAAVLMVVVPATAHREIAERIAPHLVDGQIIVLNPGRTGGAIEVASIIRQHNPSVRVYVAEAQTLLYAARVTNPGQVHIYGIKNSVPLAVLPSYQTADILPIVCKALPQFIPGTNVLVTSLDNIGAVFHPAITLLNAGRIEDTHGDFQYYVEGVTPAVARVLETIDRERVAVANALGVRTHTAREWLYLAYDAAGKTLLDAMRANPGYDGIRAPGTLNHRYVSEDVPASLVPIASIGEMLGVPTPTIRTMIHLASTMHGVDYWQEGRTVERLGISGMSARELRFLVDGTSARPDGPRST
jgi:opine dehydrogenase